MKISAQYRKFLLRPILQSVGAWSAEAEELMMWTAAAETGWLALRQFGDGPARGYFQMEGWVFKDLIDDRLQNNISKLANLKKHMDPSLSYEKNLEFNFAVQILSARYFYGEVPEALPAVDDKMGQWHYYKKHWNTAGGDTTLDEFNERWLEHGDDE